MSYRPARGPFFPSMPDGYGVPALVYRRANPAPLPHEVGLLWHELSESFALGRLLVSSGDASASAVGARLQRTSAELMDAVSSRLNLVVETGFTGAAKVGSGLSKAWSWLTKSSGKLLAAANSNKGILLGAGALAATAAVTHSYLTQDESVKRDAILADRHIGLALVEKMPTEQVAKAFGQTVGAIGQISKPEPRWTWAWALAGLVVAGGGVYYYHRKRSAA